MTALKRWNRIVFALALLGISTASGFAAVPRTMSFQGLLTDETGNPLADRQYSIEVFLYNVETGSAPRWQDTFDVETAGGVFDIILGSGAPLLLEFNAPYWATISVAGEAETTPRIPLTATAYSLNAATVDNGAITSGKIAPATVVRSLNTLRDDVTLTATGGLTVTTLGDTIVVDASAVGGVDHDWEVIGDDMYAEIPGNVGIGLQDPTAKLHIQKTDGSHSEVRVEHYPSSGSASSRVQLLANSINGYVQAHGNGDNTNKFEVYTDSQGTDLELTSHEGDVILGGDNRIALATGYTEYAELDLEGQWTLKDDDFNDVIQMGHRSVASGGQMELYQEDGTRTILLRAQATYGSIFQLMNEDEVKTFTISSEFGAPGRGAAIEMRNGLDENTVSLNAHSNPAQSGSLFLRASDGASRVVVESAELGGTLDNGAAVRLFNELGDQTIKLDAHSGALGEGKITTEILEITGGADLSERFDVLPALTLPPSSEAGSAEDELAVLKVPAPGDVVCIDSSFPGQLRISGRPYDRAVAGVISGAGGVKPGMLMGQKGVADGQQPVALTGRVYVRATVSTGPIKPGDLLTTSSKPGHAMKVVDNGRAQGAILGKAMSSLESGTGLVLVLVSLQ